MKKFLNLLSPKSLGHLLISLALLAVMPTANAADLPFVGTWKLVSQQVTDAVTGESTSIFGANPRGTVTYTPDGHIFALITASDRKPATPADDAQEAQLYRTASSFSGKYTVEGPGLMAYSLDVATNPNLVGTKQQRQWKIEGDTLTVKTAKPMLALSGKEVNFVLIWTRAK